MMYVAGLHKEGKRVVVLYSADPVVQRLHTLYEGTAVDCDWGELATDPASLALAEMILACVVGIHDNREALAQHFALGIVKTRMESNKMWVLTLAAVQSWVDRHQMVVQ